MFSRKTADHAAEVLGVSLDGLTPEIVHKAFREKAAVTHPDAGGSSEAFIAARNARDHLIAWLKTHIPQKEPDCTTCGGTGYTTVHRGFYVLKVPCPDCRGE